MGYLRKREAERRLSTEMAVQTPPPAWTPGKLPPSDWVKEDGRFHGRIKISLLCQKHLNARHRLALRKQTSCSETRMIAAGRALHICPLPVAVPPHAAAMDIAVHQGVKYHCI